MTISNPHWNANHCCCQGCMSNLADQWVSNNGASGGAAGTQRAPLPTYTYDQIAFQLTDSGQAFFGDERQAFDVSQNTTITYDASALNAVSQQFADSAFEAWAVVTGLTFVEVGFDADIDFGETQSGAYASTNVTRTGEITSAFINVSTAFLETDDDGNFVPDYNTYGFTTFIHEIGHALGLAHAGDYNGQAFYPFDALYANDSYQASIMSYFGQDENTSVNASYAEPITPMIADIIAIQNLYGVTGTRAAGNTTYGVGSNTGTYLDDLANLAETSAFTIVDDSGRDTINFSNVTQGQKIDLRSEGISDVGGLVGNMLIARGTTIEDARGGSAGDEIIGNDVSNQLIGGGGKDMLEGGAGNDLLFGGQDRDALYGGAGRDNLFGGTGGDTLYGGEGRDILRGAGGADTLVGGGGSDTYYLDTVGDVITEFGGGGFDHVISTIVGDLDLTAISQLVERATIVGTDDLDITGNARNNLILGNLGDNVITGSRGSDTLFGSAGDDALYGGADADRLIGGTGDDTLVGGGGADVFVFANGFGRDRIIGFNSDSPTEAVDVSRLSSIRSWGDLERNHLSDINGVATLTIGANSITFEGLQKSDLTEADFLF